VRIHDLSVPIRDGVDWYHEPGTDPVRLREVGSLDREGWRSSTLSLMVLNGTTYLETGAHLYPDAPMLDDIPPERFITRAFVVRLPPEHQELPAPGGDLADFRAGLDGLLLHCGWDRKLNDPDYYDASPYFSPALQEWILRHDPSILGGDMLSFDHPQDPDMPFLRRFFRGRGMILCPLVGLGVLPTDRLTLCVAPLRLAGASAAPCRVLAWENAAERW